MNDRTNHHGIIERAGRRTRGGFSLLEVLAALGILALVSSSVLIVINRCIASAANSSLRMEAFQLARENLEKVLVRDSVEEGVEYGVSERYPDVSWQTVIAAFAEPVTGKMWVRAVCSAGYTDSADEVQKVELEHWITELTDQQAGQVMQDEDLEQLEAEQLLATPEEAVEYAGIDEKTLEQWVEDGLVTTDDGAFIKYNLDLFIDSQGNPTPQDKAKQIESVAELAMSLRADLIEQEAGVGPDGTRGNDPVTGLPYDKLEQMDVGEVMDLIRQKQK